MLLSLFIPFVLAIWTASAAVQPSIDMTVGERERGTLESLLSLPLSRSELLLGKWLAVVSITAVGVTLQITGLLFGIAYLASDFIDVPSLSLYRNPPPCTRCCILRYDGHSPVSCSRHAIEICQGSRFCLDTNHACDDHAHFVNPIHQFR